MMRFVLIAGIVMPTVVLAGSLQFSDHSDTLPLAHVYDGGWEHFVGGGVAVFDCNGDGYPDFLAAGGENPVRLFVNQTNGAEWKFSDGRFAPVTGVTGAYPLDVEGDGLVDLMVLRVGANQIYRGIGDCVFEQVGRDYGFRSDEHWSTAFSATWEGDNLLPTLALGNYVDKSDPDGPFEACDVNQLYRPKNGLYITPVTLSPGHCALSMLFSDWQRTGKPDLRVSNDRHYYVRNGSEQMWQMQDLRLLGPGDGWDPISIWGMGIASQDITGDQRPEVVLTSMGDQLMQIATPDGFDAAPFSIGTYAHRPFTGGDGRPSTGWHAEFGDVNNDGREDLFIAKGNVDQMPGSAMKDPNNLLMQGADGIFVEMADQAGVATLERSRGAALVDIDRDGLLDLVVVNRRAPLELYRNISDATGNWLAITPRNSGANTFAIGSWIELRDKTGRISTKELTIGGGHVGGQLGPIHFGLGANDTTDVRVIWPDGGVSDWIDVKANQFIALWRQDSGKLRITKD